MAEASCIAGIIVWCSSPVDVQFNPCNKSMIVIQGKKQNCGTTMRSAESKIFSILKPPPPPLLFFLDIIASACYDVFLICFPCSKLFTCEAWAKMSEFFSIDHLHDSSSHLSPPSTHTHTLQPLLLMHTFFPCLQ